MLKVFCYMPVATVIGMSYIVVNIAVASDFTIPQGKLLGGEFAAASWGGSVVVTDAPGEAVRFTFSGLGGSGTGVKDDYPVDTVYGQILPSHANGDFSSFSGYTLRFANVDNESVSISLFINTGFTGPSGNPSNDATNDTFWQSVWTEIPAGQSADLRLDFDNAIPWGIGDNKDPHTTTGSDGVAGSINAYDRTELSAIGFEISSVNNLDATILVTPIPESIPTPLQGDADLDGDVDLNDLSRLATNWGAADGMGWGEGNFDGLEAITYGYPGNMGDYDVDLIDLNLMASNWLAGTTVEDTIPEPATLSLLALGGLGFVRHRRGDYKAR